MEEFSVLLIEPDAERRKTLSFGLTAEGCEVVPTVGLEEGKRFAERLDPGVVVVPADLGLEEDGRVALSGRDRAVILLGSLPEDAELLRDEAFFLATAGLDDSELVRRIRLVLLGRKIGVDPDFRLEALVGDFSMTPPLDLVRRLHGLSATSRIEAEKARLYLREGEVLAARCGATTGVKAFCRLARRQDGPFRVLFDREGHPPREIVEELDTLVATALGDAAEELPDPGSRFEVRLAPGFFAEPLTPVQQEILAVVHGGGGLEAVLDASPLPDGELLREIGVLERRGVLAPREELPRVGVVTDSAADLPSGALQQHRIGVVPLAVRFGDDPLVDGVDLEPGELYERSGRRGGHSRIGAPSADRLALEYHRRLARQDVIAVHLSERLSDTVLHARRAAEDPAMAEVARADGGQPQLAVVDSGQVGIPLGLLVLFAARMAARGRAAAEIAELLAEMSPRFQTLLVVDSLGYLARGGRVGGARAWLGKIVGSRPILALAEGEVVPVDSVRGRGRGQSRLLELARERLDPERPTIVGVTHARAESRADRLRQLIEDSFPSIEMHVAEMGPVAGALVGPGCVGATFFQPSDDERPLIARSGGA